MRRFFNMLLVAACFFTAGYAASTPERLAFDAVPYWVCALWFTSAGAARLWSLVDTTKKPHAPESTP